MQLCLMYVEPLDNPSAEHFLGDNLLYFGEPLTNSALATMNMLFSCMVWTFGKYGAHVGYCSIFMTSFFALRVCVVYLNLSDWKNPTLSSGERAKRDMECNEARNRHGGSSKKIAFVDAIETTTEIGD